MSGEKSYDSILEMVEDISEDKGFTKDVEAEIERQRLATILFTMRCRAGVAQEKLSKSVGRSQSWVSKLEHADTESISVKDLELYSRALALNLVITFQKSMSAAESVKYHFFQIKKHLDGLIALAKDDEEIRKGVDAFHNEWLANTLKHFLAGKMRLAQSKETAARPLEVVGPEDPPDDKALMLLAESLSV